MNIDAIKQNIFDVDFDRDRLILDLLKFSETDTIFFFSDKEGLFESQKKEWEPVISWLEKIFDVKLKYTTTFDVPKQDEAYFRNLEKACFDLSDKEILILYYSALCMRSVGLAFAFVSKEITSQSAFEASFLEELWQAKKWGEVIEAKDKRDETILILKEMEKVLYEES